jgi:hypothetical protein
MNIIWCARPHDTATAARIIFAENSGRFKAFFNKFVLCDETG